MKCLNGRFMLLLLAVALMTGGSLHAQRVTRTTGTDKSVSITGDQVDGDYIGGLKNGSPVYSKVVTRKDFVVSDKNGLLKALASAKKGQVVYVDDNASIDLTGAKRIPIKEGVTLASGRGKNNSKGALLYTKIEGARPLLLVSGPNVRITGLRIQGPDQKILPGKNSFTGISAEEKKKNYLTLYRENTYGGGISTGINCNFPNLVVDNCELYGWTIAAINLIKPAVNVNIHHNYIHHNQRFGLGYGVSFASASALVKGNLFDYNRHSITGGGEKGTNYEICYNKFLEHHLQAWPIDMHGGKDRKDGTNIAGTKLDIYNNVIRLFAGKEGVVIRGVPTEGANVYNNDIIYLNKSIKGDNTTGAEFVAEANKKGSSSRVARSSAGTFYESAPAAATANQRDAAIRTAVQQRNATGNMKIYDNRVERQDN